MNQLHSRHSAGGLRIVAMPSHQFKQEAETNEKIASNVKDLGVEFTLLEPADVNGPKQSPLYTWLKENTSSDDITWNFGTYFLVDRSGNQVSRHDGVNPASLEGDIETLLAETTN
eukprot:m.438043 g.438043  ORF g.438043 m.438043 type:complete len:115 (+) comp18185_c0_seq1:269-613(+)